MSLFEIGSLAVKIAGRDAGKTCVIIDKLDELFVLIDGQTRRRKCNIKHLEPLAQTLKIKKNASHEEIKAEFKKLGLEVLDTKPKEKKERPRKKRKEKLEAKKEERKKGEEEKKRTEEEKKRAKGEKAKEKKEEGKEKETGPASFEEVVEKESRKEEG